ncbi:MAG: helix-turn-helix transcriptional regulator [Ruminococcaceae bacterium]|nr:helix-turn-helix transcriptional regulator [Oscillospiraceae bacterium]
MTVGQRIQEHRKKNGLSQEELGQRLLVSRQTVSLWEKDQTLPTVDNLLLLKEIFGISVDELLGEEKEEAAEAEALEVHTFTYEKEPLRKMYKNQCAVFLFLLTFAVAITAAVWSGEGDRVYVGLLLAGVVILAFLLWNNIKERRHMLGSLPGKTVTVSLYDSELVFAAKGEGETPSQNSIPFDQIDNVVVDGFFYQLFHGSRVYFFPVSLFKKEELEPESRLEILLKSRLAKNRRTPTKGGWRWISFGLVYLCILAPSLAILGAAYLDLETLLEGNDYLAASFPLLFFPICLIPIASFAVGVYLRRKKKKAVKNIVAGLVCGLILFGMGVGGKESAADIDREYAEGTFAWAEDSLGVVLPETELMLNTLYEESPLEDGFYEFTSVCIAVISPEEREAFEAGLTPEANWLSDLPEEVKAVLPFQGGYDHILLYDGYTGEYNRLPTEEGRYYFTCLLYDEETGTVTLWEFPWEIVATS